MKINSFLIRWAMHLILFTGVVFHAHGQRLYQMNLKKDSTKKVLLHKQTIVAIATAKSSREYSALSKVDTVGLYFEEGGFVAFKDIQYFAFRPYSRGAVFVLGTYYTAMLNLGMFAYWYGATLRTQNSSTGLGFWMFSSIIWVPVPLLFYYGARPLTVHIEEIDIRSIKPFKE